MNTSTISPWRKAYLAANAIHPEHRMISRGLWPRQPWVGRPIRHIAQEDPNYLLEVWQARTVWRLYTRPWAALLEDHIERALDEAWKETTP